MTEQVFHRPCVRARLSNNPIGAVLCRYTTYLVSRGHGTSPRHQYTHAVEHFGRWLDRRPINQSTVSSFLRRHIPGCRCTKPAPRNLACVRAALNRLLEMLDLKGPVPRTDEIEPLLQDYARHLRSTCGLAEATIFYRLRYARALLQWLGVKRPRQLCCCSPVRIAGFVSTAGRKHKASSGQVLASSVRSFLRFLLLRGYIRRDLTAAVPAFANWRLAGLPKAVGPI